MATWANNGEIISPTITILDSAGSNVFDWKPVGIKWSYGINYGYGEIITTSTGTRATIVNSGG